MRTRGRLAALGAGALLSLLPRHARAEIAEYVVQAGDTCESISAKFWGSPYRYDKLHALNPKMGPMPHKLVAGTVLMVDKPGPDARVTAIHNKVEAATPAAHQAFTNEPLSRGNTVSTEARSQAEVTFRDTTRVQLGEQTLVVILGDASGKSALRSNAGDTTLVNGSLRAHLGDFSGAKVPVATAGGARVDLGKGEAKISVDEEKTTRLAVYGGTSQLSSAGKSVAVKEGFGSKAKPSTPPTPPRPLPDAPGWSTAPPRTLLGLDTASLKARYASPSDGKGPAVDRWHVQLAKDDRFNDLVVDATVPADVIELEAKELTSGLYYVRVSGIDADKFEGKFGPTQTIRVMTAKVAPAEAGKRAAIEPPKGAFCSFDGGPFVEATAALELTPARAHELSCAEKADGEGASKVTIGENLAGPVTIVATPATATTGPGIRVVTVTLKDASGAPVSGAKLTATATDGAASATVDAPAETTTKGTYTMVVHVPASVRSARVTLAVTGAGTQEVVVEGEPPPRPIDPGIKANPVDEAPDAGKPKRPRYEIAPAIDLAFPNGKSAFGGGAGLEITRRFELGFGWLGIGVRGAFAVRGEADGDTIECPTAGHCTLAGYATTVRHDTFTIGVPISLRVRAGKGLAPYLTLRPQLLWDEATTDALERSGPTALHTVDTVFRVGLDALLGVQWQLGPGAAFVEGGYRVAKAHALAAGEVPIAGGALGIGYRFAL
jgi:hypothetical protein